MDADKTIPPIAAAFERGFETFMGIRLCTAPGTLVPRRETELLAHTAVRMLREGPSAPRVIDMCTGSGNLACALGVHLPTATVWGSDLTEPCVSLARRNVDLLGLAERVTILQGDLFQPLEPLNLDGAIDMVVCNPPYISAGRLERDRSHLLSHEPREAFDAGPYGLAIHKRLAAEAPRYLKPGGHVCCEFGLGQESQVQRLFTRVGCYSNVTLVHDSDGAPRVAVARRI